MPERDVEPEPTNSNTNENTQPEEEDEDYRFAKNFQIAPNEICQIMIANTLDTDFRMNAYNNTAKAVFKVSGPDQMTYFRSLDGNYEGKAPENGKNVEIFNPAVKLILDPREFTYLYAINDASVE